MNVLVLGKGGREQALVRALAHSPKIQQVFALPGRTGFEPQAVCLTGQALEKDSLKEFIKTKNIKLVVIGPEKELVEGWSDFFRSLKVPVFGPSQKAAQLESSKLFAKNFMSSMNIPTSEFQEVSSVEDVLTASPQFGFPVVLKADGLAAGKGVFICHNKKELEESAQLLFEKKIFGQAGEKALLEVFQKGEELSVFVLTNGNDYTLLPFARDYKKLKERNQGPNTGGMGAFAPHTISPDLQKNIETTIVKPGIEGLRKNNLFYRGVLYIGLMIADQTPLVLEYNVRFGDPEAQVLLPLLEGDWAEVFLSVAEGKLPVLNWKKNAFASCVVLAGEHYPSKPVTGVPIQGNIAFESSHSYFLHAGTKKTNTEWLTDGGRVLNALGLGTSKEESIKNAYKQAAQVNWPGMQIRPDIGS
jgi:phosphoribosylamine--glycine ligase